MSTPQPLALSARFICGDSRELSSLLTGDTALPETGSVALVVCSPPYPMIAMWDELFSQLAPQSANLLAAHEGWQAFEAMQTSMMPIWKGAVDTLIPGGILCVNIGDALRTIGGNFQLYPNAAWLSQNLASLGLQQLPSIIWRKATNAPNKFMGSGVLPAGAYVTLEHEWVLIFRKGGKRSFASEEDHQRRQLSSLFWEERNLFYQDVWTDLLGVKQEVGTNPRGKDILQHHDPSAPQNTRQRSAAFPLDLALRLCMMYSVEGDTVLDPFGGIGTTALAALACGRNAVLVELDPGLAQRAARRLDNALRSQNLFDTGDVELAHSAERRLEAHQSWCTERQNRGLALKYRHARIDMPLMSLQERELCIRQVQPDSHGFIQDTGGWRIDCESKALF